MTNRASDISVDELRFLIQETARQTFEELFRDPERWADLKPDFKDKIKEVLCREH